MISRIDVINAFLDYKRTKINYLEALPIYFNDISLYLSKKLFGNYF